MELRRYILSLADPLVLLLTVVAAAVALGLFLVVGLRLSSVRNVGAKRIILAALASSVLTAVIVSVCAQGTDATIILGILLSFATTVFIIKSVLELSLEKAFLVWVLAVMSQVITVASANIAVSELKKASNTTDSSSDRTAPQEEQQLIDLSGESETITVNYELRDYQVIFTCNGKPVSGIILRVGQRVCLALTGPHPMKYYRLMGTDDGVLEPVEGESSRDSWLQVAKRKGRTRCEIWDYREDKPGVDIIVK